MKEIAEEENKRLRRHFHMCPVLESLGERAEVREGVTRTVGFYCSRPFHFLQQADCQIFNDDVPVYSPPRLIVLSPPGDNMSDSQPMGCGHILTLTGFRHYDWTLTFDISDILVGWRQNCRVLF